MMDRNEKKTKQIIEHTTLQARRKKIGAADNRACVEDNRTLCGFLQVTDPIFFGNDSIS